MRVLKICLKCGKYDTGESNISEKCRRCNGTLKETNYTSDEYIYQMQREQRHEIENKLRKRYVLNPNNTEYDEDEYYKREDEDIQLLMKAHNYRPAPKPNPNACPQCGCTQFTPVRRKWSFITGFMTNKIDMVCNQCGYVKK